ncbi:hypothetical protein CERSUDRAFT_124100 [Gelatoporia subvermispora B]|uniref:BTB domain-containing protein n=1 Tax=Ceriporiopsis subvermispora (strain B) TaxID=914234 RepID=M2PLC4_CERS8|nr:hypothetical protein CERSUDRAFT_124100 [Gelatoporia subvermispora B]
MSASSAAPAPFDDQNQSADIIIRSSDGVCFYVHKLIISQASPIFHDMFLIPQPVSGDDEGFTKRPMVDMIEESKIWDIILRICYPVPKPLVSCLHDIHAILEAARKYQIEVVSQEMRRTLLLPLVLERHPCRVYALACIYNLPDIAQAAARNTLHQPFLEDEAELPELVLMTGLQYHQLLQYRKKCQEVVATLTALGPFWTWAGCHIVGGPVFGFGAIPPCTQCTKGTSRVGAQKIPEFIKQYVRSAAKVLEDTPYGAAVCTRPVLEPAMTSASRCDKCREKSIGRILDIATTFAKQIDDRLNEIKFPVTRDVRPSGH